MESQVKKQTLRYLPLWATKSMLHSLSGEGKTKAAYTKTKEMKCGGFFLYIAVEMDNLLILSAGNASCQNYALQAEFWNNLLWRIVSEDSKQANKKD